MFDKVLDATLRHNDKVISKKFSLGYPASIYLLKVNNRNTITKCEISSNLTIKTPYFTFCPIVSIVNFEHVIDGWVSFISIDYKTFSTLKILIQYSHVYGSLPNFASNIKQIWDN